MVASLCIGFNCLTLPLNVTRNAAVDRQETREEKAPSRRPVAPSWGLAAAGTPGPGL